MLQNTFFISYEDLIKTGKINKQQAQVMKALINHPFPVTNLEIAHLTGLPINCVTPRVKELRGKGLVKKAYVKKEGRQAIAWRVAKDIS